MRDHPVDISVLIPTWNGASLIEECVVKAVDACRSFAYEILIYDNGSCDNTRELLQRLAQSNLNIRYYSSESNLFFAKATNELASHAQGRFLLLLNNDVHLSTGCVDQMVSRMGDESSIGGVVPQLRYPDGRIQTTCRRLPTLSRLLAEGCGIASLWPHLGWKMREFRHDRESLVEQPMMSAFLIRRRCWDEVGPLDERFPLYFNDVDWCKRALDKGWRIVFTPKATAVHLEGWSGKRLGFRQVRLSAKGLHDYFMKHHIPSRLSPRYPLLMLCCLGLYLRWCLKRLPL